MSRILGLCIVVVLGFYVAWPAYSAFAIKAAVESGDATELEAKVDFDQVRASLKPAVGTEVDKALSTAFQQSGKDNAQLLAQLKTGLMPSVVDLALATIVTPESLLRIYREGGDARKVIAKIVSEKIGGGGLGALAGLASGKVNGATLGDIFKTIGRSAPEDAQAATPGVQASEPGAAVLPARLGVANIKSFAITGPLGFSVGIAKVAAATQPDVTVDMAFTGMDWKVVGVRPRV